MILETKQSDFLKQWMVIKLKPICDADHEVLSEYIMALLRHDQPQEELMTLCFKQLEDFLQQDTKLFVTDLFDHLRTCGAFNGSYQPSETSQSTSTALRKRSLVLDEPYLLPTTSLLNSLENQLPQSSAPIPQYTPTQSHPSFLHFPDSQPSALQSSPHFSNSTIPPYVSNCNPPKNPKRPRKSGICRDYHYRGYCARGGNCQFSHDDKHNSSSSSSLTTVYYSKDLSGDTGPATVPSTGSGLPLAFTPPLHQQIPGLGGPLPIMCDISTPAFSSNSWKPMIDRSDTQNSRYNDRPSHPDGPSPSNKKSSTTLIIENIPQASLSDRAVREYFSHFGILSSVTVDAYTAQATVTFNSPEDAKRAHSSPEPVFNNRFVRVHFKRLGPSLPRRYQGTPRTGFNELESVTHNGSAEYLQFNNGYHPPRSLETSAAPFVNPSVPQSGSSTSSQLPSDVQQLSQRQEELRMKIDAQKRLLEQLSKKKAHDHQDASEISPDSPSKPIADLKNQQFSSTEQPQGNGNVSESTELDSMGDSKHLSPEPCPRLPSPSKPISPVATDSNPLKRTTPTYVRGGRKFATLPRNSRTSWVASASISMPTKSFKLDNRSCTLSIKGIPSLDARDTVKSYLEQFGTIVSVGPLDEDKSVPDMRLQFATRAAAENALASGTEIPDVGKVTMNWASIVASPATTTTASSLNSDPTHSSSIPGLRNSHHHHYNPGSFSLINHHNLNPSPYSLIGSMKIENPQKLINDQKVKIQDVGSTNGITGHHNLETTVVDDDLNDDFCVDDEIDGCWKR